MSEHYSLGQFADFIKRAAAFLPDLRGMSAGEAQLTVESEPSFRKLCMKISELAGYDEDKVAPFVTMELVTGRVTVESSRDKTWKKDLGDELLDLWIADKAAHKLLVETIAAYRLLVSKVDTAMTAVKARSSQRGETLDELLD